MNASIGSIPAGAFVAAIDAQDKQLILCRTIGASPCPGYYDPAKGCTITMVKKIEYKTTFQVLSGKGFYWDYQDAPSNEALPENALPVGRDNLGKVYFGRANIHETAYVGKISNNWYFNKDGVETSHPWTFVLVCTP